jgi:hypothetical protein
LSCGAQRFKSVRRVTKYLCPSVSSTIAAIGFVTCACSGAKIRSVGPDTWRVECTNSMATCAARADELCGDRGYTILGGQSRKEVYGPEGQQIAQELGELLVQCRQHQRPATPETGQARSWRLNPPRSGAPVELAAPARRPAEGVCTPGETQTCVGPGACHGGQACMADGSGFQPCDCGTSGGGSPAEGPDAGIPIP